LGRGAEMSLQNDAGEHVEREIHLPERYTVLNVEQIEVYPRRST